MSSMLAFNVHKQFFSRFMPYLVHNLQPLIIFTVSIEFAYLLRAFGSHWSAGLHASSSFFS